MSSKPLRVSLSQSLPLVVLLQGAAGLLLAGCEKDEMPVLFEECADVGRQVCAGNQVWICQAREGGGAWWFYGGPPCDPGQCTQFRAKNGSTQYGCTVPNVQCSGLGQSLCSGNAVVMCSADDKPIFRENCDYSDSWEPMYCVAGNDAGTAACSYLPTLCPANTANICVYGQGDATGGVASCDNNGIASSFTHWNVYPAPSGGDACVSGSCRTEGQKGCLSGNVHLQCSGGLWTVTQESGTCICDGSTTLCPWQS